MLENSIHYPIRNQNKSFEIRKRVRENLMNKEELVQDYSRENINNISNNVSNNISNSIGKIRNRVDNYYIQNDSLFKPQTNSDNMKRIFNQNILPPNPNLDNSSNQIQNQFENYITPSPPRSEIQNKVKYSPIKKNNFDEMPANHSNLKETNEKRKLNPIFKKY